MKKEKKINKNKNQSNNPKDIPSDDFFVSDSEQE